MRTHFKTFLFTGSLLALGLHNFQLQASVNELEARPVVQVLAPLDIVQTPADPQSPQPGDDEQTRKELESLKAFEAEMEQEGDVVLVGTLSAYQRRLANPKAAPVGPWGRTRGQGCRLARMCISEDTRPLRRVSGGGTEASLTADCHGIANVVANNKGRLLLRRHRLKGKVKNWEQVMGELSPHVNRVVELKTGKPRQVWTSSLPCAGDEQPEGWDADPQAGDWEVARMFWPDFRDLVTRMWLTDAFKLVPGKPIGWGSMSGDIPNALGRGMILVPWGDGRNGFVRWPRTGLIASNP